MEEPRFRIDAREGSWDEFFESVLLEVRADGGGFALVRR